MIEYLNQLAQRRYEAHISIGGILEQMKNKAIAGAKEKYLGELITAYENDYEVFGVRANAWNRGENSPVFSIEVSLTLFFTAKHKLPKAKREKLAQVKEDYNNDMRTPWNNYNIPLWFKKTYDVTIESILLGNFSLNIYD